MNGQRGELYRMWFTNLHDFKFTLDLVVIRVLLQLLSELVDFSSLDAEQLEGVTLRNGEKCPTLRCSSLEISSTFLVVAACMSAVAVF